jgi:hypothetical protein
MVFFSIQGLDGSESDMYWERHVHCYRRRRNLPSSPNEVHDASRRGSVRAVKKLPQSLLHNPCQLLGSALARQARQSSNGIFLSYYLVMHICQYPS